MLQDIINFLQELGYWGLFIATALEASSVPFPGAFVTLLFGSILPVSTWQLVIISFVNSLVFSVFSLIPYWIGTHIHRFYRKKLDAQKLEKAQIWFQKYGTWSIALSRPLSIGNYISFFSGISNINIWRYLIFTFLGTFPWGTFLLFVGRSGDIKSINHFLTKLENVSWYILLPVLLVGIIWGYFVWRKNRRNKMQKPLIQQKEVYKKPAG